MVCLLFSSMMDGCQKENALIDKIYAAAMRSQFPQVVSTASSVSQAAVNSATVRVKKQLSFAQRFKIAQQVLQVDCKDKDALLRLQVAVHKDLRNFNRQEIVSWAEFTKTFGYTRPEDTITPEEVQLSQEDEARFERFKSHFISHWASIIAYHEAGHAYVSAKLGRDDMINYLELGLDKKAYAQDPKSAGMRGGGIRFISLLESGEHSSFQDYLQNKITVCFAGVIAQQVFASKLYTIASWLSMFGWHHGGFYSEDHAIRDFYDGYDDNGSDDIELIVCYAGVYCKRFLLQPRVANYKPCVESEIKLDIKSLLRHCYAQAYFEIYDHQEQVEKIALHLAKDLEISGDLIYEYAQTPRPKYFFEKSEYIENESAVKIQALMRGYAHRKSKK